MTDTEGALFILVVWVGGILFTLIIQDTELWAALEQMHSAIAAGIEGAVQAVATVIRRRSK